MPDTVLAETLAETRVNVARLEVQVAHLTISLGELQEVNKRQSAQLDEVLRTLSEARGGWKTLMVVGGAASTVGACLSWLIQHLPKG